MNNTNTPPRLFALTPIDQTDGLEDGAYWVRIKGFPHLSMEVFDNGKWKSNYINMATHYLRPLPEGTRVLKPGEVAVSEKELKHLRECKNKLSELEIEYDRLHEEAMIWKYESGNT